MQRSRTSDGANAIVPFPSNRVLFPAALCSLSPASNVISLLFLPLPLSYQITGQMQPHLLSFDKTSHSFVKIFFFAAHIFPKRPFLLSAFFRAKGFSYGAAAGKGIAFQKSGRGLLPWPPSCRRSGIDGFFSFSNGTAYNCQRIIILLHFIFIPCKNSRCGAILSLFSHETAALFLLFLPYIINNAFQAPQLS